MTTNQKYHRPNQPQSDTDINGIVTDKKRPKTETDKNRNRYTNRELNANHVEIWKDETEPNPIYLIIF